MEEERDVLENSIDELDLTQHLADQQQRRAYLVTYSQRDLKKFPTRESFACCAVNAFHADGYLDVIQWACCREDHQTTGVHYHLALKLKSPKRLKTIMEKIFKENGIVLRFSAQHTGYNVAYKYVCKSDSDVVHSQGHPNLHRIGSPSTKKGMKANAQKRRSSSVSNQRQQSASTGKAKRLSNIEVAEFMIQNK